MQEGPEVLFIQLFEQGDGPGPRGGDAGPPYPPHRLLTPRGWPLAPQPGTTLFVGGSRIARSDATWPSHERLRLSRLRVAGVVDLGVELGLPTRIH